MSGRWLFTAAARLGLLLVLASLLGGCLGVRFVYGQLDWFIAWRLNGFFDIEADQERELRRLVAENLDWIAVRQLPAYAALMTSVADDVAADALTPERLHARFLQSVALWDDLLRHVSSDAARFLHGLDESQIEAFLANLAENNTELWEEFAGEGPDERRARREKAIAGSVQRFSGRLDRNQIAMIAGTVASMHDNSAEWMDGRRAWQLRFAALLRSHPPIAEFEAQIRALLLNPNVADSADYRSQVADNQRILFQLLADLARTFDERQRRRFVRKLNQLADDLDAISRREYVRESSAPA